ncbi:MAG: elongation factor P [Bacteroidetes bacterium]|nr:elongation factor P [Bacteroidota bacterium]MDA1332624.1 elongation factor P [Bacteroidota bacterium]
MADTSDFKNGFTMTWNNGIWTIIEFQHVKPGKGGAFVRTKLRNVTNGKVVDNTFRAGEKVEQVRVERRTFQFLYEDDLGLHFMNTDTYEQINLPVDAIEGRRFIKEGANIDILVHAETEEALTTEIPASVELMVTQCDPGLKGDTATGATKPATLESGATVYVPLFINEGDVIRVNTERGDYITRVSAG